MPQEINITPEDIVYAEGILLSDNKTFDSERRDFITNLQTIDLQAVPGSGKTTALLAKLLILERHLPFQDGSGVLVLSHTNTAIDEIKDKIKSHCPKLFSYPNFVGTIQSFVDDFLAKPCGQNLLKTRISWIDKDKYEEEVYRKFLSIAWSQEYEKPTTWFYSRHIQRAKQEAAKSTRTEKDICNELIEKEIKTLYYNFIADEIQNTNNETVLKTNTNKKFIGLKTIIEEVLSKGIISYDYAYHLGELYLQKMPKIKSLLQKRFSYVFVDEMQDMDKHQYDLLENVFYDGGNSISKYQRIGDKNQAIYNGIVKTEDVWQDRATVLPLNGSQRLTAAVADVVNSFALYSDSGFRVNGLREGTLKPHVFVYTNNTLSNVIPSYAKLVKEFQEAGDLSITPKHPVKVVAWNSEWKTQEDKDNAEKIRLVDYHPNFKKNDHKPKPDYQNLKSYLLYYDKDRKTLEPIRKSILNALINILRIENIEDEQGRNYTKRKLIDFLKSADILNSTNAYETLKLHLYTWSIGIVRGKTNDVWEEIKTYVPEFLKIFNNATIKNCTSFVNTQVIETNETNTSEVKTASNNINISGVEIDVTTVHSSKGQTHSATLYLESFFDGEYETITLNKAFTTTTVGAKISILQQEIDQLNAEIIALNGGRGTKTKETKIKSLNTQINKVAQATKMAYVGLSRPTHLLCLAVHKDRFDSHLDDIDRDKWVVINVQAN
jgi:DNA helicase-2/ATP-dependent DNA helicase PcrA